MSLFSLFLLCFILFAYSIIRRIKVIAICFWSARAYCVQDGSRPRDPLALWPHIDAVDIAPDRWQSRDAQDKRVIKICWTDAPHARMYLECSICFNNCTDYKYWELDAAQGHTRRKVLPAWKAWQVIPPRPNRTVSRQKCCPIRQSIQQWRQLSTQPTTSTRPRFHYCYHRSNICKSCLLYMNYRFIGF